MFFRPPSLLLKLVEDDKPSQLTYFLSPAYIICPLVKKHSFNYERMVKHILLKQADSKCVLHRVPKKATYSHKDQKIARVMIFVVGSVYNVM